MNAKAPMVAFGAGGQTNLDPAILVAMFLAIVLILFLPRKYVIIPLLFLSLPLLFLSLPLLFLLLLNIV